jgi:hypothetical protein
MSRSGIIQRNAPRDSRCQRTPSELRFFVDESALGLGKTLAIARRDVIHAGHPLIPEVPLDPYWIPAVGGRGLAVIAREKRVRTKPAELAL